MAKVFYRDELPEVLSFRDDKKKREKEQAFKSSSFIRRRAGVWLRGLINNLISEACFVLRVIFWYR